MIPKKNDETNIEDKSNKITKESKLIGNRFAEVVNDENDVDDNQNEKAEPTMEMNIKKCKTPMPRVQNWKKMNVIEHTAQHGCSARCDLCPGGVGPDLMKATLHERFRGNQDP